MKEDKSQIKLLMQLFFSMLYISTFTFGGGFVIITLMKKRFTDRYKWIDEQEMLDITAIAQSVPGPIALNAAVILGKRLGGVKGIIAASLGTVIPPVAIISLVSLFYNAFSENIYISTMLKGMSAGVSAVVLDAVCSLSEKFVKNKKIFEILLIVLSFALVFVFDINVIIIILTAVAAGTIIALVKRRKAAEK